MPGRSIVIIGAGVVGVGLADELARLGELYVTVVDKGPLFSTGGSSSHAPGLVSRTSPSKFMFDTADYTIRKFQELSSQEGPAFPGIGTLEVAYNPARLDELWRRHNAALAFGWQGRMIDADEALAQWPLLRREGLLGAFSTQDEGVAAALRAVNAMAARAQSRGVRFVGETQITGLATSGGRVLGVTTAGGRIDADVVICCAGVWTPTFAQQVGLTLPIVPMEHQYVITESVKELGANKDNYATLPIIRHHDAGLYFRDHGDRIGIGSFHHRSLPVAPEEIDRHRRNTSHDLSFEFTEGDWIDAWRLATDLLPSLSGVAFSEQFNGVFGFTPDGYPVVGEHPDVSGLWFAASVWVTHSQGVARMLAETLVNGASEMDLSPAELGRFDDRELLPSFYQARSSDQYTDIYLAHHPVEPHGSARDVRFSAFASSERALGAVFFDVATWERPQWFEANAALIGGLTVPKRDEWSSRHWSPIGLAEHQAVRERAGLFDMSPLYRIEVSGHGAAAYLLQVVAGRTDGPIGSVVYSVILDLRGGVRSDVTVARLAIDRYWICGNGPRDLAWLKQHLPTDGSVTVEYVSDALACAAVWGPAAREILSETTDADVSNDGFPYLSVRPLSLNGLLVTAARISYAGELGWEITVPVSDGPALWELLWNAGRAHGLVAAGRAALGTLRLEKGFRAWGTDLTSEHGPVEAGLGFTVRRDASEFIGRQGLVDRPDPRVQLRGLRFDGSQVAMGGEPVMVAGEAAGFITSAGFGMSVGAPIALAWLPTDVEIGAAVEVGYINHTLEAKVVAEPFFDPKGTRVRS